MGLEDRIRTDRIKDIEKHVPYFGNYLNLYAQTGHETYSKMVEFELEIIKDNFGKGYYDYFNNIYQEVRRVRSVHGRKE